jgi:amino acid transporter
MLILALSINCLFSTLIWCIVVAIVIALIVWVIGYLGIGIPAIITKLIVVLGVVICIYLIVMCLAGAPVGHGVIGP